MATYDDLRRVPLFSELPDADLDVICEQCCDARVDAGEVLFREGDEGDAAYVITGGSLEIVKETAERDVVLAVRKPGEVIGEMALLQDEPRMATARARDDVSLLLIPKPAMAHLLDTSPGAVRALFGIILERLRTTESQLRQSERMAQLGTLTAGVAHELNNPAAAVKRAADQLDDAVRAFGQAVASAAPHLDASHRDLLDPGAGAPDADTGQLSALERSDLEADLEDALADAGVAEPWTVAADLADAGVDLADLERIVEATDPDGVGPVLTALGAGRSVAGLLHAVGEGSDRLSSIVKALKSYSFLDQAPVQDVDVTEGIEDTLLILGAKLSGLRVERDYADDLTRIEAHGSELNQVWTNLLDNAADAIADRRAAEGDDAAGTIAIRAANDEHGIVVEITDDGPGIAPENVQRIFDSFFTTKEPGKGTGLGLDISYRIVVTGHGGDLSVDSEPGRTTFRVELPTGTTDPAGTAQTTDTLEEGS